MKNIMKSTFYVAAAAAVGITSTLPAFVSAWGDSDGNSRPSYTIDQINQGVLGDKIVLNSISDSVIGDEKNFVAALLDDGSHNNSQKSGQEDEIIAENGKDYLIRLYVHNNNPKGEEAVATGVTTAFNISQASSTSVSVKGIIETENASPRNYWDDVVFKSKDGKKFHLEYYAGSALLENNGIGKNGGVKLSDDIVKNGVKIGYNALDGRVPGCYQYDNFVGIKVKVVYDEGSEFTVSKQVRKVGEKTWQEKVNANVRDEVEFQIVYKNTSNADQTQVSIKDVLPKNLEYVPGSTMLYSVKYPNGLAMKDGLIGEGLNIGTFTPNSNAAIRFKAKVVDQSLNCGDNTLTNIGKVSVDGKIAYQDDASVVTNKVCTNPDKPVTPDTPKELPATGPETIISGVLGAGSLTTAAGYFVASRKALKRS